MEKFKLLKSLRISTALAVLEQKFLFWLYSILQFDRATEPPPEIH